MKTMTHTLSEPALKQIRESIRDWKTDELIVDRQGRVVRNVALAGLSSRNGYRYSEQALREALPLYANKPVFLDHAANLSRPWDRSTRDLVGSIENPRFERGRVRGDIRTLDTEAGRTFLALADANGPAVGMSHVVLAERGADGKIVERIHDVISVDAVVFPATTSTLKESCRPPSESLPGSYEHVAASIDAQLDAHLRRTGALTESETARRAGLFCDCVVVEIRSPGRGATPAAADDAVGDRETKSDATQSTSRTLRLGWHLRGGEVVLDEHVEPFDATDCNGEPAMLCERSDEPAERALLQDELEKLRVACRTYRSLLARMHERQRRERKKRRIEEMLRAAALPESALSPLFRRMLDEAPDDQTRRRLIADRLALWRSANRSKPYSTARSDAGEQPDDRQAFISAVKGRRRSVLSGVS